MIVFLLVRVSSVSISPNWDSSLNDIAIGAISSTFVAFLFQLHTDFRTDKIRKKSLELLLSELFISIKGYYLLWTNIFSTLDIGIDSCELTPTELAHTVEQLFENGQLQPAYCHSFVYANVEEIYKSVLNVESELSLFILQSDIHQDTLTLISELKKLFWIPYRYMGDQYVEGDGCTVPFTNDINITLPKILSAHPLFRDFSSKKLDVDDLWNSVPM